jgi:hypothetical protein
MSINPSLQENEVDEQGQRVMFNVRIREFLAIRLNNEVRSNLGTPEKPFHELTHCSRRKL